MNAPTAVAPAQRPAPEPAAPRVAPLMVRLHFYAGVLIGPFLVVAAVTGLLYTAAPQIDAVLYGDQLRAASPAGPPVPLAEQVAAAQQAVPGLDVVSVAVPDDPGATTQVVFEDPSLTEDRQRTVYVDPGSGTVQGDLVTWFGSTPAVTWLDDLHRNLHLGEVGRHYSELAASWLWVVALGGVALWLRRRRTTRRLRRTLLPELSARGRRRTLSWHGSTGLLLVLGLLFLSATGLTWSRYAGEHFGAALVALDATAPELDTSLPGGASSSFRLSDVGEVLGSARRAGLDGPVEVTVPTDGGTWTVAQTDDRWPVRMDAVAVDPLSMEVTTVNAWADRPLLAKASSLGISAHMGFLFGPLNQLLLAAVAVGLLCVIFWGYRAWWQRRPSRPAERPALLGRPVPVGRLPRRGAWRALPRPALVAGVVLTAGLAWALPLFGIPLAGFLVLDAALGARGRRRGAQVSAVPVQPSQAVADDPAEELLV